ncbi:MAG: hypothetical protein MZW92_29125 [Comamonadaceae bacterium]|nr:hypothetical protein [Comamonadaceae bacterium]
MFTVTPAQAAPIVTNISRYQVELYNGIDKLGIIRLYTSSSPNVVAYLHFHRSTATMPAERVSLDSVNGVHVHYLSTEWPSFLMLLDTRGTSLKFTYDMTYKTTQLTRESTITP